MKPAVREAFRAEMAAATRLYHSGDLAGSFGHLERAHVLGQRFIIPHTLTHWWMLKIGARRGDAREIAGQLARIAGSLLFSRIWVPVGNTGGANVKALRPLPVPEDLQRILDS